MLFNIESDSGDRLVGYIVPDGYTGDPSVTVRGGGETLLVIPANDVKEALVTAGRHETGRCGFIIDSTLIPRLGEIVDLELVETESKTLIYRRRQARFLSAKLLRLETHLYPLHRLDDRLAYEFQYGATQIDRQGRETTTQLFLLDLVDSIYLSGRILYRNFSYYADTSFTTVAMLHDPYVELAERLVFLRNARQFGPSVLGEREAMRLEPVIAFAETLPLKDEKELGRALRKMPGDVSAALTNPVVRQLTTTTPDEMPNSGAVAYALDLLASFAIVGLRRDTKTPVNAIAELLNLDPTSFPPIPTNPAIETLGEVLRRSRTVDHLIDKDVELYSYVAAAFEKVV